MPSAKWWPFCIGRVNDVSNSNVTYLISNMNIISSGTTGTKPPTFLHSDKYFLRSNTFVIKPPTFLHSDQYCLQSNSLVIKLPTFLHSDKYFLRSITFGYQWLCITSSQPKICGCYQKVSSFHQHNVSHSVVSRWNKRLDLNSFTVSLHNPDSKLPTGLCKGLTLASKNTLNPLGLWALQNLYRWVSARKT